MSQIEKTGPNTWLIRVCTRVKGKDYPVRKQETFTGTKIEADARTARMIDELRNREDSRSLTIKTFSVALDIFKEKKGPFSRSHSARIDYMKRELGHIPLETFADDFEKYLKIYKSTPRIVNKKLKITRKRSAASSNRLIIVARSVFNLLVDLEYMDKNPISKARFTLLEEKPRDRYLTAEERLRLMNAIREHRPYLLPITEYMLLVPCRKLELTKARREQYNAFTNTIYIPDSKAGISINKPVPESLKEYFRSIPATCPWLFYREDESGFHPLGDFKGAWKYCLKKAELSNFRVHDTRHLAITFLIEQGNNEHIVSDVAGWKSTAMLKNYRHLDTLKSAQSIRFGEPSENKKPATVAVNS